MINNRVSVITGGANGIGLATAELFVMNGAKVVIADICEESGKKSQDILNSKVPGSCLFVKTDTSSEKSVRCLIDETMNKFGDISILINCANRFIMKGIDATAEDWSNSCATNITGYALCAKYCLPSMKNYGKGSIVNICSISAYVAQPDFVTYSAAKGAVASMTRCLALDLANHNIRVNAVSPGTVWTKSNETFHRDVLRMSREDADNHRDIGGRHILGRTADPSEIAESILFLASDKSSYITGENIMVDGGYTVL